MDTLLLVQVQATQHITMTMTITLYSLFYFFIIIKDAEVIYFGDDGGEIVADVGNNADLYAANQGSTELINEVYTEEAPLRFMGQDVFHHQPLSLD